MSDILDANRKNAGGDDFEYQLATAGGGDLYPIPSGSALVEIERIAGALLDLRRGRGGQVITFASTVSGEGSSFVSYSVARHISFMIGQKVAWVDANFRSPQNSLVDDGVNFRDLLANPDTFNDLSTGSELTLIPHGNKHIRTTDLLESDSYPELLTQFQEKFALTILDAPPVSESIDVGRLASPTMGLVLTIEARRLKHQIIRHGIDKLNSQGVNILGSVVNRMVYDVPAAIYNRL
jgi:polysaccharide biosynthesis transport protein